MEPTSAYRPDDWCFKGDAEECIDNRRKTPRGKKTVQSGRMRPRDIFVNLACLVMFLLLVIPCWNAIGLLRDDVYVYMTNGQCPLWLLISLVLLFVISYITLKLFIERIRPELRTEQTLLMVSGIFLSTLGILLILFGGPIARGALKAHKEFMTDCKFGPATSNLYIAYEELSSLRQSKHCIDQDSVQDCDGWLTFPQRTEARVLKTMEKDYSCSGICQGMNDKGEHIYPPTLFTKANNKVSCDGMAARRMMNFAGEVSSQMVAEGCLLVGTAIVISVAQLITFCSRAPKNDDRMAGKSYGATQ